MSRIFPATVRKIKAADHAATLGVTGLLTKPSSRLSNVFGPTERSSAPSSTVLILDQRSSSLRRCKVVIINSAFRRALKNLLEQFLGQANEDAFEVADEAEALAQAWFTDKEAKKQVSEILARFNLDESAIEAEAIRRSSSDLELLDRMLTSLESRRNKALGCVANIAPAWYTSCGRPQTTSLMAKVFFDSKMQPAIAQPRPDHGERTANCRQPSQRTQEHRSAFRRG
jgi:hypothetical protein